MCVLSSRLKDSTDEAALMLTGNVFHAEGPATVKERVLRNSRPGYQDCRHTDPVRYLADLGCMLA